MCGLTKSPARDWRVLFIHVDKLAGVTRYFPIELIRKLARDLLDLTKIKAHVGSILCMVRSLAV